MTDREALAAALAEFSEFDDIYDDWELGRASLETYQRAVLQIHDALHLLESAARERLAQMSPYSAELVERIIEALRGRTGSAYSVIADLVLDALNGETP